MFYIVWLGFFEVQNLTLKKKIISYVLFCLVRKLMRFKPNSEKKNNFLCFILFG